MNLLRRIKNLWEISAYKIDELDVRNVSVGIGQKTLRKDFPTVEKKLATIIKEPVDYFTDA